MQYFSISIILVILILIQSCKKYCPPESCPTCPLSNGEYCTNGYININDACVCPEGSFDYGANCVEKTFGSFYFNINCLCFDALNIGFNSNNGSVGYNISCNGQVSIAGLGNYEGDTSSFLVRFWDWKCTLPTGNRASPWLVGGISNDTMRFEIEWHFFYWQDSTGTIFLEEPEMGEYISPLYYLDSIADYSCGEYFAIRE